MRVTVAGRAVMDRWENAVGQFEALKIQANRIAILPHRITMVNLAPSQGQSALQNNLRSKRRCSHYRYLGQTLTQTRTHSSE